jgi:(1->4)-alpha-D-glucan 1-alpha-D-glucosylmutase
MTDPDNRRPVDFKTRATALETLQQPSSTHSYLASLLHNWTDGRVKLFLTAKALEFRNSHADLFLKGDYISLYAGGRMHQQVCSFMRTYKKEALLVAVPRFTTKITEAGKFPLGATIWGTGRLNLPAGRARRWANVLTGEHLESGAGPRTLLLSSLFNQFPVALLYSS